MAAVWSFWDCWFSDVALFRHLSTASQLCYALYLERVSFMRPIWLVQK